MKFIPQKKTLVISKIPVISTAPLVISPIVEMTKYTGLIFILLLLSLSAKAQTAKNKGDSVEITETDFASLPTFNGSHATVFGIPLGIGRSAAEEKLKNYLYLKFKVDPFNHKRYYIMDMSGDSGVTIAYLKWPNYDSGLYQIILYPAASKYLRGLSASIVTNACIDPKSDIYKTFLGAPSGSQVTSDIPSIKSKTVMLYYPRRNIVIEEDQNDDKTTYDLVLTLKF